jgi:hypothetical protein
MGFHCSWLAVRGAGPDDVFRHLGLEVESDYDDDFLDTGLYGISLPTGWYLTIGDGWDYMDRIREEHAVKLSTAGEALYFTTDDTSMNTMLTSYQHGKPSWAITYDGSAGVSEPELQGMLPDVVQRSDRPG